MRGGHILHLAPVEEILGPEPGLAAEHALGLFGSEIVRNGLELVQEILRRTDSKSEIRFEPVGAGDIRDSTSDSLKLMAAG